MKKYNKAPQWIVAKRLRKKAKRRGIKVGNPHSTRLIKISK